MKNNELKTTHLSTEHQKLSAVMIDFAGWQLPVYYTSIIREHEHTRRDASIFDISHMGEILVTGDNAARFLQYIMTNNLARLKPNTCFYSAMCYEHGGTVDDCFVYMFTPDHYWIVVNAANILKDLAWLEEHAKQFNVSVSDLSPSISKIDLQGPLAEFILQQLTRKNLSPVKRFSVFKSAVADSPCTISRSGYTGEDGFEIYCENKDVVRIWDALLQSDKRVQPAGLGARDTLRIEACYSLYGHELDEDISPVEAGIGWVVREKSSEYIGKNILIRQKKQGTDRKLMAFTMSDRGIARSGYEIYSGDTHVGTVSSGCYSPTLSTSIGLGFITTAHALVNSTIKIKIREKYYQAKLVNKPFYSYKGG
jgi:glycine cleavage system T protein